MWCSFWAPAPSAPSLHRPASSRALKLSSAGDISDSSLESSKQFGADYTVNSKTQDIVAEVQKITNGHGCTVAFDSACFPGSLTMIMQPGIVCNAGRVVPMGFCTVPKRSPSR